MSQLLDKLYDASNKALASGFIKSCYKLKPFNQDKNRQYSGNVIQLLLMEIEKINPKNNDRHSGYSSKEWQEYKEVCTRNALMLINKNTINSFSSIDLATSLHRIAKIRISGVSISNLNSIIPLLFNKFNKHKEGADSQAIANTLWAIGKLVETASLSLENDDKQAVLSLVKAFNELKKKAKPQEIANTLWALGKLVEARALSLEDDHKNTALSLLKILNEAKPQEIANALWALGKLVEAASLSLEDDDIKAVLSLLNAFNELKEKANSQEIANTLWAIGKLVEATSLNLKDVDKNAVLSLLKALNKHKEKANSQEIANTLWAIGKLVDATSLNLKDDDENAVLSLLNAFNEYKEKGKPQEIANTLWAIGKLVEATSLNLKDDDENTVLSLLNAFNEYKEKAKPQEIANTLWAIGKLVEAASLSLEDDDIKAVLSLLNAFNELKEKANSQNIANTLWAIAKLVEARSLNLEDEDKNAVLSLLQAFSEPKKEATPLAIANTLWALGIAFSQDKETDKKIEELFNSLLSQLKSPNTQEKNQVIMAAGLLSIEFTQTLQKYVDECRPVSALTEQQINNEVGTQNYTCEAFVCGFYVDVLIEDSKKIIEFDGKHHAQGWQKRFDKFRDAVLEANGYTITRVATTQQNESYHIEKENKEIVSAQISHPDVLNREESTGTVLSKSGLFALPKEQNQNTPNNHIQIKI